MWEGVGEQGFKIRTWSFLKRRWRLLEIVSIVSVNNVYFFEIKFLPLIFFIVIPFLCTSHRQRVWPPLPLVSALCQRDSQQITEAVISIVFGFAVLVFLSCVVSFQVCVCVKVCLCVWKKKEGRSGRKCIKLFCLWDVNRTNCGDIRVKDHQFILEEEWSCRHKLPFNQFWRPLHDVL